MSRGANGPQSDHIATAPGARDRLQGERGGEADWAGGNLREARSREKVREEGRA